MHRAGDRKSLFLELGQVVQEKGAIEKGHHSLATPGDKTDTGMTVTATKWPEAVPPFESI
jgi:hypothetical protein